jgi:hypothetical protein
MHMKNLAFLLVTFSAFASCNPSKTKTETAAGIADSAAPAEMKIQVPNQECYALTGKDTVFLKLEKFPNVVTGALSYKIKEKDSNKGTIDGVLRGDTLLADYTFASEGTTSTRQVIFLIKDGMATEGYGSMEEKKGKMQFKDRRMVDFSKGLRLKRTDCPVE